MLSGGFYLVLHVYVVSDDWPPNIQQYTSTMYIFVAVL